MRIAYKDVLYLMLNAFLHNDNVTRQGELFTLIIGARIESLV